MIFLKSLAGGIVSAIFVWIIIVAIYMWHVTLMSRQQANTGGFLLQVVGTTFFTGR